jgi:hypothetical protein
MRSVIGIAVFLSFVASNSACRKAPENLFDAQRAFRFLREQCELGPRVPGTLGHEKGREYIVNALKKTSADVELQEFTHKTMAGEVLSLTNIHARFGNSKDRILLCAHWDTRPTADNDPDPQARTQPIPGANDGASGVAVLLEVARVLAERTPPLGVDIVLFDGEDYGSFLKMEDVLIGSTYFSRKSRGYRPKAAILIDMVGDRNLQILQEGYSLESSPQLVARIWQLAGKLGYSWVFLDGESGQIVDDHLPLNQAGIPCIDLIDMQYSYWHTREDTPDKCSPESLKIIGTVLLKLIYEQ